MFTVNSVFVVIIQYVHSDIIVWMDVEIHGIEIVSDNIKVTLFYELFI